MRGTGVIIPHRTQHDEKENEIAGGKHIGGNGIILIAQVGRQDAPAPQRAVRPCQQAVRMPRYPTCVYGFEQRENKPHQHKHCRTLPVRTAQMQPQHPQPHNGNGKRQGNTLSAGSGKNDGKGKQGEQRARQTGT